VSGNPLIDATVVCGLTAVFLTVGTAAFTHAELRR
jgi:hypothetical protein